MMIQIPPSNRRPHVRHVRWFVGVFALIATLFAGCTADTGNSARLASSQKLVYANAGGGPLVEPYFDPTDDTKDVGGLNIDPAFSGDLYSQTVLNMIQMQLVTFDNNLNIIPDAATWQKSADSKTWTFTLRPGMEWSDGTPLTAADFKAGILHALDPNLCTEDSPLVDPDTANQQPCPGQQTQFFYLSYIQGASAYALGQATDITGIKTSPDGQTITFQLTDPISFFLDDLATAASMPLETAVYNQFKGHFIDQYVNQKAQSGPFMIKSWYNAANPSDTKPTESTEIVFVTNPHWWGKKPTLTEVDMPLIVSQDDAYQEYVDGKVDYSQVPSHQYPYAQDLPDFHATNAFTIDYFGMNQQIAPFNNLQVRQAFDLALNKQLLVDNVFQGARVPTNHIIPQGIPGYNPGLLNPPDNTASAALTGNQAKAQQLITQLATQCLSDYSQSWCPAIIGKKSYNTSLQSIGTVTGNPACPDYKVFATTNSDNTFTTTQTLINTYAPLGNPDRVKMMQQSTQEWFTVMCLNLAMKTEGFGILLGDISKNVNQTSPTKPEGLWTLGYSADYPDPQDFTSNQFVPTSINDSANLGIGGHDAAIETQMHQADIEQDVTKRYQDYQQIEQELVNNVAWIPFDQSLFTYRVRSYVVNLSVPQDSIIPDQSWSNIFIVAH